MSLLTAQQWQALCETPGASWVLDRQGRLWRDELPPDAPAELHLIPGSFNPLHDGHRWLHAAACEAAGSAEAVFFEVSLVRRDKPLLEREELNARLKQFLSKYQVVIVSASYFSEKLRLPLWAGRRLVFHIGVDVWQRLCRDHSRKELLALTCHFVVYDREYRGAAAELLDATKFSDEQRLVSLGVALPEEVLRLSSTRLRGEGRWGTSA